MSEFLKDAPPSRSHEAILAELEQLFTMDTVNLDKEALRQTTIFYKVQNMIMTEGQRLRWLIGKYEQLKLYRRKYYLGILPSAVYQAEPLKVKPLKTEVDLYMKADPMMQEIKAAMDDQDAKMKLLEDSLKRVKDRGFDIKNAIQWRSLMEVGH